MKHTDIKIGGWIILKPYRAKAYGLTDKASFKVYKIYFKDNGRKTPWIICEDGGNIGNLLWFKPSDILHCKVGV